MSDAQEPADLPIGGPSWMRGRRPAPTAAPDADPAPTGAIDAVTSPVPSVVGAPSAPAPAAPAAAGPAPAPGGVLDLDAEAPRPPTLSYSRHAVTPVPFALAALASIVALLVAVPWARRGRPDGDLETLRTLNEVWFSVENLLTARLDGSFLRSPTKATVVLALSAVVAVAVAAWVARLGRNLPLTEASFGAGFAVLGLPAWWTLALTLGTLDDPSPRRIDLIVRLAFAAGLLVIQYVLVRWGLLNRIWRAGRLPYDQASILLWLPELIPWMMYLGSSITTLVITEDGDLPADTWRPTPAMVDWGRALSAASTAAILLLLVVVTIRQHVGMAEDRGVDAAAREADRRRRMATGGLAAP